MYIYIHILLLEGSKQFLLKKFSLPLLVHPQHNENPEQKHAIYKFVLSNCLINPFRTNGVYIGIQCNF